MGPPQPGPEVLPPHSMNVDQSPEPVTPVVYSTHNDHASSTSPSKLVVKLVCRALTAALTFISLIILASNNTSSLVEFTCTGVVAYVKFYDVYAYRYMLFIILLALVYSLLQTAFSIFHLTSKKRVHHALAAVDFYGDLVLLYALASASSAGFGATVDLSRELNGDGLRDYFMRANATASLLFFASIFTAVSLVLSK